MIYRFFKRHLRVRGAALYALIVFALVHCGPTPEKFIEKSQAALAREDYDSALLYMKNAYELSLPKDFFVTTRDLSFSHLRASHDGQRILLVEKKIPKKAYESTRIYAIDRQKGSQQKNTMRGKIRDVNFSPDGLQAVFLQQPTESIKDCKLWLWQISADKMIEAGASHCVTKPAVKNDGTVWYMKQDQIHTFDSKTGKDSLFNRGQRPEKSARKFPAYAHFYAAPDNKVWMIYGAAGSYRLYQLSEKTKLVSKEIAASRLYLVAESRIPGVFIGGAGAQQFVTLNPKDSQIGRRMKAKVWGDAAFVNDRQYYYIEDGVLAYRDGNKETELPFWAEQLAVGVKDELLFLSSTGSAMRYTQKMPPAESLKIYNKAVEIDDSKS
jgi:dipeptidyl aminopeptidase/acylaminoacyl peptidase